MRQELFASPTNRLVSDIESLGDGMARLNSLCPENLQKQSQKPERLLLHFDDVDPTVQTTPIQYHPTNPFVQKSILDESLEY